MTKALALPHTRTALEHLAQAVSRLEAALDARGELDAALSAELDAARADQAALRQVVDTVSERLDGAIDRLQTALEED